MSFSHIIPIVAVGASSVLKFSPPDKLKKPSSPIPLPVSEIPSASPTLKKMVSKAHEGEAVHRCAINFFSFDPDLNLNEDFYYQGKAAILAASASRAVFSSISKPEEVEIKEVSEDAAEMEKKEKTSALSWLSSIVSNPVSHAVSFGKNYLVNIFKQSLNDSGIKVSDELIEKFISLPFATEDSRKKIEEEVLNLLKSKGQQMGLEALHKIEKLCMEKVRKKISNILKTNISIEQTIGILRSVTKGLSVRETINEFIDIGLAIALSKVTQNLPVEMRPYITRANFQLFKNIYDGKNLELILSKSNKWLQQKLSFPPEMKPEAIKDILLSVINQDHEKFKTLLAENQIKTPVDLESLRNAVLAELKKECEHLFGRELSSGEINLILAIFGGKLDPALIMSKIRTEGAEIVSQLCKELKVPKAIAEGLKGGIKSEHSILASSMWSAAVGAFEEHGKRILQASAKKVWVIGPFLSEGLGMAAENGVAVIKGDKEGIKRSLLTSNVLTSAEKSLGLPEGALDQDRFLKLHHLYENREILFEEFKKSFKGESEKVFSAFLSEQEKFLDLPEGMLTPAFFERMDKSNVLANAFNKKMIKDGITTLAQVGALLLFPGSGLIAASAINYGAAWVVDAVADVLNK